TFAVGMLLAGLVYDARLQRTAFSWLPFAIAFPQLPLHPCFGAGAHAPPGSQFLLPVACLAGPTLQLANGLVDVERDAAGGVRGLVARLGRRRACSPLFVLHLPIGALALATVLADPASSNGTRGVVLGAAGLAFGGVG